MDCCSEVSEREIGSSTVKTPVLKPYLPVIIEALVGEHTG